MEGVLIILIVLQAVFISLGSFDIARKIKSERKQLERLLEFAVGLPIVMYGIDIILNYVKTNEMVLGDISLLIQFWFISAVVNSITGLIIIMISKKLLCYRR